MTQISHFLYNQKENIKITASFKKNLNSENPNLSISSRIPTKIHSQSKMVPKGMPTSVETNTVSSQGPYNKTLTKAHENFKTIGTYKSNVTSQTQKNGKLAFGSTMAIFALFLLLNAQTTLCVPVGRGLDLQEIKSATKGQHSQPMATVDDMGQVDTESGNDVESLRNLNYVGRPQSQLYLPSLLKSAKVGDGNSVSRLGVKHHDFIRNQKHQRNELAKEGKWETVIDPHLYLLTEWNSDPNPQQQQQRMRRNSGPSLSIVNPLDVLRQRLLLEIVRRKMRQSHNQILANAEILKNIGRRR